MKIFNDKIFLAGFVICFALALANNNPIASHFWGAMAVIVGACAYHKLANLNNTNNEKRQ